MKIVMNIVGILLVLVGGVWFLQGEKVVMGSPMTGHSQWIYIGAAVVVVGLGLLLFTNLRRMSAPKS